MPHRPFTRRQALQNAAFLAALRRTGNPRLAAALLGVHRSTYTKRRAKSAAFAQQWDAELAAAHAAFHAAGGPTSPEPHSFVIATPDLIRGKQSSTGSPRRCAPRDDGRNVRTKGGELHVARTRNGRLQLRRAPAGWMTKAGEQAYFRALSATANVRLAAAAAGFSHSAFYAKKRTRPAFAREMRLSLAMGYDRVECAALAAALPDSYEDDAWRHNDPPPIPPMTPDQAIQLLYLHQKEVRLQAEPPHIKRRRGESREAHSIRLSAMYQARLQRDREAFDIAEAARRERGEAAWAEEGENELPALPALDQVTGWSKANPDRAKAVHNPDLALFGGWRLRDWERQVAREQRCERSGASELRTQTAQPGRRGGRPKAG
jgi:hypothetical protein